METTEHTTIGNLLRITELNNNPYLRLDAQGVLYLKLQRFSEDGIPLPMSLEMSSGEIIAMAGDYFTQADWAVNVYLPSLQGFTSIKNLASNLIKRPIQTQEEDAFIMAYNNLASPLVSRKNIDEIYDIDNTDYIPFSGSLNQYAQQLMYYLKVKDYGEMLDRNITHFTPWSVRVYLLGHHIALKCARLSYELNLLAEYPNYQSDNPDMRKLLNALIGRPEKLIDLAHRFHAQALATELFTFHYYSDHFAAGHMSMIGDLRVLLTKQFGVFGSILVNSMHNELNTFGVYTKKAYAPEPDEFDTPIPAYGDGDFDGTPNRFNKASCLRGMQASLGDIHATLLGANVPKPSQFAGLHELPDVDYNYRQHQPLLILSRGRMYHRDPLDEIRILSPSKYEQIRANPKAHGYVPLESTWDAFKLVVKLRTLPFIYDAKVIPLTQTELTAIELDEAQRHQRPKTISKTPSEIVLPDWKKPTHLPVFNRESLFKEPAESDSLIPKAERAILRLGNTVS